MDVLRRVCLFAFALHLVDANHVFLQHTRYGIRTETANNVIDPIRFVRIKPF